MKRLLAAAFTVLAVSAFAQNNSELEGGKLRLSASFSPDYCYRVYSRTDMPTTAPVDWMKEYYDDIEIDRIGYTATAGLQWRLNERFSFETGINFSSQGWRSKKLTLGHYPPTQPGGAIMVIRTINEYDYLGVPLRFTTTLGENRLKFTSGVSLIPEFMVMTRGGIVHYVDGERERDVDSGGTGDFNGFGLAVGLNAGIEYQLNDQMHLRVEPNFRYGLLQIIDAPMTDHLYSAGLNLGFYYSL